MSISYKINLYLGLLKYSIREKFIRNKDKHFLFLKKYFKNKENGFYIDVGCYHPIRISNTKFLYDKGWNGINIDISKRSIDLFDIARKKDINLNIGVGNKNRTSVAYFKKALFHANTIDYEHSKKFLGESEKKKIKVQTLNSIINKYAKNKKIDFIDIDCEGKDMEVLQGLDLKRNKIDLVSVEMHGYDKNTQRKGQLIFNIMKKNKYKKIYGNYPDNIIFKKYKK
jgi:FkbM family methyltransferase|tara:strand:- start:596 stop:1273 length:678 start_codon:yes stop_codon:yes gene_type:complete